MQGRNLIFLGFLSSLKFIDDLAIVDFTKSRDLLLTKTRGGRVKGIWFSQFAFFNLGTEIS